MAHVPSDFSRKYQTRRQNNEYAWKETRSSRTRDWPQEIKKEVSEEKHATRKKTERQIFGLLFTKKNIYGYENDAILQ